MPVIIPGIISGSTTLTKALAGGHPKSCAASYRLASIWRSFGSTERITYGRQKVICARMMDSIPSSQSNALATNTNSSIRETPVTISGLTIGKFVTFITRRFRHFFILLMPMAAAVPSTVANIAATRAIIRVFFRASSSIRSSNIWTYHLKVKPDQTVLLFVAESLKEKTIRTTIGAYKKIKIKAT